MLARAFAILLVLAVSQAARAETDRNDPRAVSAVFLTAFKARDTATLATLVNRYNRKFFEEIAAEGESHPGYAEVFGGWRGAAADAWDGTTLELRFDGEQAVVRFGDIAADEVAVLVLSDEDGWAVADINSPDRADFEALPDSR